MKLTLLTCFLVSLLLTSSINRASSIAPRASIAPQSSGSCGSKCNFRCSKAGVKDRCLKYCNICCMKCQCVPSGTYGHKDECPCYRDLKNSKGQGKCP